jgi:hypothetical protein
MDHNYEHTEFSKSILAGVFAGIASVVLCLIYNTAFRNASGFPLSEMINVSTIIFALLLVVTLAGYIFYLLHHYFKRGTLIFQLGAVVVTALLMAGSMQVDRSNNLLFTKQFHELLAGIVLITGLSIVFIIPYLFRNDYV